MRCAVRVIERYGSDSLKEEWLPHLIDGSWGATICISEADAGSDVPRLRTVATPGEDGLWLVSGEKMWISFGDHDLCSRIGHLVLARTRDASTTLTGLSLFLVPSEIAGETNHVLVRRIEEKLGLHCSPTCALGFENAKGWLIGTPGRGLSQLFTMIVGMRLSVGSQGAGIAGAAAALAWRYAAERRQGGRPDVPPVTIDQHGDVRRMLLAIAARAEVARGLVLTASAIDDLRTREPDDVAKAEAADQLAWLLPITKNFCAEAAFTCASEAIQVLGGAGYTREWQAEQYLRDARVLSIYEGTSGMQALDLVTRRVIGGEGRAMKAFLTRAKQDIEKSAGTWAAGQLSMLLEMLDVASQDLDAEQAAVIAYPFLQIASLATTGWIALRLANLSGNTMNNHLAALGRHWLRLSVPLALAEAQQIAMGTDLVTEYCFVDASNIIGRTL
jgi:alkylation response protein AidB-like acyl-CoA dehydrogenase